MSIVVIPGVPQPEIADDDYAGLLAAVGGSHAPQQDQDDYRAVLRSFLAVMRKIEAMDDYVPDAVVAEGLHGRTYTVPTAAENPFNAWSHRCAIQFDVPPGQGHPRLAGRALAVKDNISVGGLPTTCGTSPLLLTAARPDGQWPMAAVDAVAVARLLRAGVVVRGTTTCEAWCASPLSNTSYSGPVHNPRLHGHVAGGSTSGGAAVVAAGQLLAEGTLTAEAAGTTAAFSIGTDQAGSVRIPACYNGLYGLKPTFGLVPYTGAGSMAPMIDHVGPLATTLEDVAALLEVLAGSDGLDPRMPPEAPMRGGVKGYGGLLADFRRGGNTRKWKIGLLRESFSVPGLTPVVRDTVYDTARAAFTAAGATVVDVSVPLHADGAAIWNAATRPSMASWLLQGRPGGHLTFVPPHLQAPRPAAFPPEAATFDRLQANNPAAVNVLLSQAAAQRGVVPPGLEAKAHRLVLKLRAAYDRALDDEEDEVDVLVTPCAPDVAKPLPAEGAQTDDHSSSVAARLAYAVGTTNNTSPFNVTGHPALSVPCGSAAHAARPDVMLPIGMQIVGRRFRDEDVLLAAALFERGRGVIRDDLT